MDAHVLRPARIAPALALALAAALALGCTPENPDDLFFYVGRVTDLDGAPRAGATASLWKLRSYICAPTDRPLLLYTETSLEIGPPYARVKDLTANAEGLFYADLMRFELAPGTGLGRCYAFLAEGEGGARTRIAVDGEAKDIDFPNLAVWDGDGAALTVEAGSPPRVPMPALPWPQTPPLPSGIPIEDTSRHMGYDWVLTQGDGQIFWHQLAPDGALLLEPELMEDFPSPRVALQAWVREVAVQTGLFGAVDTTVFRGMHQSRELPVSAPGVVPASRGATCRFGGEPLAGCFLTDGSLELKLLPPALPSEIVLELAQPLVPRLLVLRDITGVFPGVPITLEVEGSADGATWRPLAPAGFTFEPAPGRSYFNTFVAPGSTFRLPLDSAGNAVQQIRLTAGDQTSFQAAREISVFE